MASGVLSSCCYRFSLRKGILTYIYISLTLLVIYSFLVIIGNHLVNEALRRQPDDPKLQEASANMKIATTGLLVSLLGLPFLLCGLAGVHKEKVGLIKIFYYFFFVRVIISVPYAIFGPSTNSIPVRVIVLILDTALNIYMLIVVRSEIIRLESETNPNSSQEHLSVYQSKIKGYNVLKV